MKRKPDAVAHVETMDWVVLDIQVLNNASAGDFGEGDKVVGFWDTTVGTLAIPPALPVAIDDVAWGALDGDVDAGDVDEVAGPVVVAEGCCTREGHDGVGEEFGKSEG